MIHSGSLNKIASVMLPEKLKSILLLIIDPQVRSKFFQDFRIARLQKRALLKKYKSDVRRLIIFLVPGLDIVNGGILSICSLFNESEKLRQIHGAEVVVCSLPDKTNLHDYRFRHRKNRFHTFTKFKNSVEVFELKDVLNYFGSLDTIVIHVPELYVGELITGLAKENICLNKYSKEIISNVLLQNIKFIPSNSEISKLKSLSTRITCTTAHEQYTTREIRNYFDCPVHLFSVWASPEQYCFKKYPEKQDLLVVSPDHHPSKKSILDSIRTIFPQLEIRIVENITYETFKQWMSEAKWTLTFGEGLDGYFGEGVFSGAIGFAVYNEEFFTRDFENFKTIYRSYDELMKRICVDLKNYDVNDVYVEYQKSQYDLLCSFYSYNAYVENIEKYYKGDYTHH